IKEPRRRHFDLGGAIAGINASGIVEVDGLAPARGTDVVPLKEDRAAKTYRVLLRMAPPVEEAKLKSTLPVLVAEPIAQRTLERDHGEDAAEVPPRPAPAWAFPHHPVVPVLRSRRARDDRDRFEPAERVAAPPLPRHDRDRRRAAGGRVPRRRPLRRSHQTGRRPARAPEARVGGTDGGVLRVPRGAESH